MNESHRPARAAQRQRALLCARGNTGDLLAATHLAGYAAGMQKEQLQATLWRLHDELSQTEGVDPDTLARLRSITDELQLALDQPDDRSDDVESSVSGLKDLLLKFEAEHPKLSATIGRVADTLAAMGI